MLARAKAKKGDEEVERLSKKKKFASRLDFHILSRSQDGLDIDPPTKEIDPSILDRSHCGLKIVDLDRSTRSTVVDPGSRIRIETGCVDFDHFFARQQKNAPVCAQMRAGAGRGAEGRRRRLKTRSEGESATGALLRYEGQGGRGGRGSGRR